ncbi:MAG: helix-turn-helix domain-containing protein [Candidatus Dormibacteraeota bacterium]|nr:helix-turn-helix domain-containing protein [Candidatus Dormibacteraeota bacterium]
MLGCGRTLVYDLIGSRQLPVVKIGRLTRVPVAAIDDFVTSHVATTRPTSPPIGSRFDRVGTRGSLLPAVFAGEPAQGQLFEDRPERPGAAAGMERHGRPRANNPPRGRV